MSIFLFSPLWGPLSGTLQYEVYLKMAQNCCDRDRITWLDMHSNFKLARNERENIRAILKFECMSRYPISATAVLGHFEVYLVPILSIPPKCSDFFNESSNKSICLETLHTSLSRCNRLRDVDLAAVSLIEPSSGAYVELNELSSKFNSSILILQTDDSSYKKSTNQHSFSRKIQVQKMKCSQCNASQWFRRPKFCR